MKKLFFLLLSLVALPLLAAKDNSLENTLNPKLYKKRSEPVLNITLLYYGDYYKDEDLERIQNLLEERFFKATGELLRLKTHARLIIPFKHKIESYPDYRQEHVTEIERLQRLWYYDNVNYKIINEIYGTLKTDYKEAAKLKDIDVIAAVTGAQFDALGFASGRVGITENPMEIAWGLPGGGRVEFVSDYKVVDELIHEIGHAIFLDHASNQCHKPGMDYAAQIACCKESPAKDDVMSYCRNRSLVNETVFFGFKECNRRNIKDKIIPAMLKGKEWNIANREKCL